MKVNRIIGESRNPREMEMMEDEKVKWASSGSDDDDEEANQDLSLKIVEKHLLMRAAKLDDDNTQSQSSPTVAAREDNVVVLDDNTQSQSSPIVAAAQEDNIVLRKLLRGPRYFDPPDSNSNLQACFNCGEEGHMAVNCNSAFKRKKPCFVCGSFDHGAKSCSKAQDCFICKKNGHRAKDCPEKSKSGSQNVKMCLKCGDSGHDMFSCTNSYSLDDLKEVQCYICKSFGHLCCVDFGDTGPTEVSCFKCGQMGHTGLACNRLRGESNTDTASLSSCYKCGETGHFARECIRSAKVRKRNFEQSTPTLKRHRKNKDYSGIKSAPHDLGKAPKKKKPQYDKKMITTPRKSEQRGGWINEDPGDLLHEKGKRKNPWRSSATPSGKGHQISTLTADGSISSSKSNKNRNFHHNRFSASRFDNSGSDGIRRNYNWW